MVQANQIGLTDGQSKCYNWFFRLHVMKYPPYLGGYFILHLLVHRLNI
jgi:hypothetical protein